MRVLKKISEMLKGVWRVFFGKGKPGVPHIPNNIPPPPKVFRKGEKRYGKKLDFLTAYMLSVREAHPLIGTTLMILNLKEQQKKDKKK